MSFSISSFSTIQAGSVPTDGENQSVQVTVSSGASDDKPKLRPLAELWSDLKTLFNTTVKNVFLGLQNIVTMYPQVEPVINALAQRCCLLSGYFDPPTLLDFAKLCEASSIDSLETHVLGLYRDRMTLHTNDILNVYPEREAFLRPGVAAHMRGEYALSIMCFLAQADGICAQGLKANLFHGSDALRADFQRRLAELIPDKALVQIDIFTPYRRLMLQPLSDLLPIGFNQKKRQEASYNGLNRNLFLHGEASAQDLTEENSLRAFSVLSHVASVCQSIAFWDELSERQEPKTHA